MENSNLNSYWFGKIEGLMSSIDFVGTVRTMTEEEAEKVHLTLSLMVNTIEALKKNIRSESNDL
jgi:hypothetical protein